MPLSSERVDVHARAPHVYLGAPDGWRDIQTRLDAKLNQPHGVDWELLKLEFQRDLWLLALSVEEWMRLWDREFDNGQKTVIRGRG